MGHWMDIGNREFIYSIVYDMLNKSKANKYRTLTGDTLCSFCRCCSTPSGWLKFISWQLLLLLFCWTCRAEFTALAAAAIAAAAATADIGVDVLIFTGAGNLFTVGVVALPITLFDDADNAANADAAAAAAEEDVVDVLPPFGPKQSTRPLTCSNWAVRKKSLMASWLMFTSPLYMNRSRFSTSEAHTSRKMTIGCSHGLAFSNFRKYGEQALSTTLCAVNERVSQAMVTSTKSSSSRRCRNEDRIDDWKSFHLSEYCCWSFVTVRGEACGETGASILMPVVLLFSVVWMRVDSVMLDTVGWPVDSHRTIIEDDERAIETTHNQLDITIILYCFIVN